MNQHCFQRCHYWDLIHLLASLWLKTYSRGEAAPKKEQYVSMVGRFDPALPDASPRLFFHEPYYQIGKSDYSKDPAALWTKQSALGRSAQVTQLSFSAGNKLESNEGVHCSHFRRALMLPWLSCKHYIVVQAKWRITRQTNQCTELIHVWDKARLCQRTLPTSLRGAKWICIRTERHPKITHLFVSRVPFLVDNGCRMVKGSGDAINRDCRTREHQTSMQLPAFNPWHPNWVGSGPL